jgi:hypothetical protein
MQNLGRVTDPKDLGRQDDPLGPQSTITAAVTGGVSSTADFDLAVLTIPAGYVSVAGQAFFADVLARFTKANGGVDLNIWVKINGTKVGTVTLTQTNPSQTDTAKQIASRITVRSVGPTGMLGVITHVNSQRDGNNIQIQNGYGTITINTANAITITVGANLSVSNAGHSLTAEFARIGQL